MARQFKNTAWSSRPRRVMVLLGVLGAVAAFAFTAMSALAASGPTVSSFTLVGASPTNATSVSWKVVFSSSVTGVTASSFTLQPAGGVTSAGPVTVSGSGSSYTVSASTGAGNGTLGLNLPSAAASSIKDSSNHALQGAPYTGPVYTIDKTAPTATITTVGSTPTNASSVSWSVVFTEPVTGVTSTGFQLVVGGGLGGSPAVTGLSGSGTTYTVTASTGSGNGTLALKLPASGSVKDSAGNSFATAATGPAFTLDRTPPTATITTVGSTTTNASSVSWSVVFSKPVTGVTSAGFQLVIAGGLGGTPTVTGLSGSGITYTVTASTGTGNGTLAVKLPASASVKDSAGNSFATAATGPAFTLDRTPPTVTMSRTDPSPTNASVVHWSVVFNKPVTGVTASNFSLNTSGITGPVSVTGVTGSGTSYTVAASTGTGTPSGTGSEQLRLASGGSIKDLAGNSPSVPVNGDTYTVDHLAPTIVSINMADPSPTNHGPLHWTVTFNEPVLNVLAGDFGLVKPGLGGIAPTITGIAPATGPSSTWMVTVSTTGTTGTDTSLIGLNLTGKGTVADQAGNPLGGSTPVVGQTYMYDTTLPVAPTILLGPLPKSPGAVPYNFALFSFTDPEAGGGDDSGTGGFLCKLDTGSFTPCPGIEAYTNLSQGLHTFQVEAVDPAGNISSPTSWSWFVDTVPPTVTFTQTPPNPSTTATSTFNWTGSDPAPGSGITYYLCSKENGAFVPCPAGTPPNPYTFAVQTTSSGEHQFAVEAVDNAGNVSAPAIYTWKVVKNSGQSYTISGVVSSLLYPGGAAQPINLSFSNPNVGNGGSGVNGVQVSNLTVTIQSITGPNITVARPCTTADFAVVQFTGAYPFYIPQGASSLSAITPAIPSSQWPSIQLINRLTVNQDGCKGATITLHYTGTP